MVKPNKIKKPTQIKAITVMESMLQFRSNSFWMKFNGAMPITGRSESDTVNERFLRDAFLCL